MATITHCWDLKKPVCKPAGGFAFVSISQLILPWCARELGLISGAGMRVYFAALEMRERRMAAARLCKKSSRAKARRFCEEELAALTGLAVPRVRQQLRQIQQAGLLTFDVSEIKLPRRQSQLPVELTERYLGMIAGITNQRRKVPVPRRVLRHVSQKVSRAEVATILGHLIRCVYWQPKQGGCRAVGACKATWIAKTFGLHVRTVRAARSRIAATTAMSTEEERRNGGEVVRQPQVLRGPLLRLLPTEQWYQNRYGLRVEFNLEWDGSVDCLQGDDGVRKEVRGLQQSREQSTPSVLDRTQSPTPCLNKKLFTRSNQEPAEGRPAGFLRSKRGSDSPSTMANVLRKDLSSTKRIDALHQDASKRGWVVPGQMGRLLCRAMARYVLQVADNPAALFRSNVQHGRWNFIRDCHEQEARRSLNGVARSVRAPVNERTRKREVRLNDPMDLLRVAGVSVDALEPVQGQEKGQGTAPPRQYPGQSDSGVAA